MQMADNSSYKSRCHVVIKDCRLLPIRTSVAALSCVAQRYCSVATMTHSRAIPDNTAMRNMEDRRASAASKALLFEPREACIPDLIRRTGSFACRLCHPPSYEDVCIGAVKLDAP